MRVTRILSAATSLATAGLIAFAGAAHAEGTFTSYIDNWGVGKESRDWTDKDRDETVTAIKLEGCRYTNRRGFTSAHLELMRNVTMGPDKYLGQKKFACAKSATQTWGKPQSAGYHFVLRKVNDMTLPPDRLTAKKVIVRY